MTTQLQLRDLEVSRRAYLQGRDAVRKSLSRGTRISNPFHQGHPLHEAFETGVKAESRTAKLGEPSGLAK